jgi:O-methyltransferase
MDPKDYKQLLTDTEDAILGEGHRIGILGLNRIALDLLRSLSAAGLTRAVIGIYVAKNPVGFDLSVPVKPLEALLEDQVDALVVASDAMKEQLLSEALPYISGAPKAIIAGYRHFDFRDERFEQLVRNLQVPSIANGYPNCLVHLYQCLTNAARLGLQGGVVEFGTYKGGTTAFLAQTVRRLGQEWPITSFDTFDGFPPRRSFLDMYDNADCVFRDVTAVRRYLDHQGVRLVEGDIVETVDQIAGQPLVLSFVDTDNYTSAMAALGVIQETTVAGGAIVFDHYTGMERFRYTLGERFAAKALEADRRYFNLHGTGVFLRQR